MKTTVPEVLSWLRSHSAEEVRPQHDGDWSLIIESVAPAHETRPNTLAFWTGNGTLTNPQGCILTPYGKGDVRSAGLMTIEVASPRLAYIRLATHLVPVPTPSPGVSKLASVHPTALVHPTAAVGDFVSVGARCSVGAETRLEPGVVLYADVKIGARAWIHAQAVIGARGFGLERNEKGRWEPFPHYGGVCVEDDVEIGANACIDQASFGTTRVGQGSKIDNLVHIAHNVQIEADVIVIANAMIAGHVRLCAGAYVAPSASILEGVTVGRNAFVGLGAVVTKDVPEGATVAGAPARLLTDFKKLTKVWAASVITS